jgi:hypothetical protein
VTVKRGAPPARLGRRAFVVASAFALGARAEPDGGATPRPRAGEATKLDAILGAIAKARRGVKTMRASFTQERTMKLLATTVRSTGQLAFVAPDRLRWELGPPDDVVYWIGPEGLSYRTRSSSASVATARAGGKGASIARALADLRALVAGDLAALGDRYVLSVTNGPKGVEVSGAAKDPKAASVRGFTLALAPDLVMPLHARLLEGKSDTIDVTFSNGAVNVPIDPRLMKP